jgi:DNA polymerase III epsilon subunit-like protein
MLDKWPHIIQLAFILYDTENPAKSKIFNKYIDIPDSVKITKETEKIHHITREKISKLSNKKKGSIASVLNEFLRNVEEADVIVGHNVDFDRTMIISEVLRINEHKNEKLLNIMFDDSRFECTQKITKPTIKSGKYKWKGPKLIESYKHFFGYSPKPEMLHDAIIDVIICLRVYCISLQEPFDIFNDNKKITNYINKITPKPLTKCKKHLISITTKRRTRKMDNK